MKLAVRRDHELPAADSYIRFVVMVNDSTAEVVAWRILTARQSSIVNQVEAESLR